ncbi:hypothetical protein PVL29_018886 [Vitis rotundifolia]|uniref:Reverse transcriptase Ty1/copia-type domain-containing protein n=1 Tax=Vitis rotundifolia TaxID=103349 RepID=A0AA39DGF2_VITRO|nr:hypothetical protein PVL29_018886 [Vitis rotundifolia]
MLNHALPIKLDRNNYVLWRTQMENVIFANGFEDHIEGLKIFGYQSSHAAWFALERIFSASSRVRVMQLRLEFQTTRKGSLTMMEYILKLKSLADNLAAIGEPVTDRDQILQLLGGLGADYNSIVASLTAREDEMSLHSVHSILLTHEQRLSFQNSVAKDNIISANLATPQYTHFNNKRSFNTNPSGTNGGRSQSSQHRPQCQLCGKFGHTMVRCYHRFDINFKNQVQAMIASPSTISDEAWFFDTGATHHLSQSVDLLSDVQPYMGNDKVIVGNGRLYVTRHIVFHETMFPFQSTPDQSSSIVTVPTPALLPCSSSPVSSLPSHTTPSTSSPLLTNMPSSTTSLPDLIQVPFADISTSEPHLINQHPMAVKDPNWVLAMEKEFSTLQRNNTWHLVPLPSNSNIIGCKWVYKLKYKPDGTVDRYKARLVAQGFTQTLGLDYFETFSPILVHQLDVQNAFLHGDLEEHVFMYQPPGFINSQFPSHVCKLNKALYGLKQAPRAWYTKLSTSLLSWGFQASRADNSMFIHHSAQDILILLIYVDDILVIGSNSAQVSSFITRLNSSFALRDLGYVNYFLGIKVVHYGTMFHLSQHKHTQDLLTRTTMLDSKPTTTPGLLGQTLSHLDGEPLSDATLYRSTAARLAANPVFHARTKHIEMDLHFIWDHVLRKQLIIQYLSSSEQVADIFTKHISSSQFLSFKTKLSVVP